MNRSSLISYTGRHCWILFSCWFVYHHWKLQWYSEVKCMSLVSWKDVREKSSSCPKAKWFPITSTNQPCLTVFFTLKFGSELDNLRCESGLLDLWLMLVLMTEEALDGVKPISIMSGSLMLYLVHMLLPRMLGLWISLMDSPLHNPLSTWPSSCLECTLNR